MIVNSFLTIIERMESVVEARFVRAKRASNSGNRSLESAVELWMDFMRLRSGGREELMGTEALNANDGFTDMRRRERACAAMVCTVDSGRSSGDVESGSDDDGVGIVGREE